MITALLTEVLLLKHWEVKVHKATSIPFCTAPGQSSDLATLMTAPLETCPGVEMNKRYMTLPLLCYSCPVNVFLCFIQPSLDKVTAEEQLTGRSPPCRSYRNRAEKAAGTKFSPLFHNLIQDKKNPYHYACLKGKRIKFYLGNLDSVMESRLGYLIFASPFKGSKNWDKQQPQDFSLW